jgi:hypothetical protein
MLKHLFLPSAATWSSCPVVTPGHMVQRAEDLECWGGPGALKWAVKRGEGATSIPSLPKQGPPCQSPLSQAATRASEAFKCQWFSLNHQQSADIQLNHLLTDFPRRSSCLLNIAFLFRLGIS